MEPKDDRALAAMLQASQDAGFLGPGDPWGHVDHALAFWAAADRVRSTPPDAALDLGSGGGVPGLVLARRVWPETRWLLLDGSVRRVAFLEEQAAALGLADRVQALAERAELTGRRPEHRGAYDLVVSRSFGAPAVVAECAAPFLRVGGLLVVSDPPAERAGAHDGRWPAGPLAEFGLEVARTEAGPPALTVLVQRTPCPDAWPRAVGRPAKRPAF